MADKLIKIEQQTNGGASALSQPNGILIGRLVHKYFFTTIKKDQRLLSLCGLTFLDLNGRRIDVDVWSVNEGTKALYLFRKLKVNHVYKLSNCSRFIAPNKKYSNSQFKMANVRNIWVEAHPDEIFNPRSYVPCTTSIPDALGQIEHGGTVNIMATYIARHRGPRKYFNHSQELIAHGHLVEFEDRYSIRFFVMLWQPRNIRTPYYLFAAEPGEIMFIANCRALTIPLERNRYVKDPRAPHFTTLSHAVSNSLAVAPEKFRELRRRIPRVNQNDGSMSNQNGDSPRRSKKANSHK